MFGEKGGDIPGESFCLAEVTKPGNHAPNTTGYTQIRITHTHTHTHTHTLFSFNRLGATEMCPH